LTVGFAAGASQAMARIARVKPASTQRQDAVNIDPAKVYR
jgi:hypothetical protein